jgi:ATP-dependent DNA helicase RecG
VGSRRAYASGQDERVLSERRRAQDLFDDLLPQIRAGLEDLDLQFFREVYLPLAIHAEVLAENERSIEQQLMACHFLTPEQIPTTLGILSLAKNPANFIPGAYVQFVRFRGAEMDIVENQLEIRGRINEIIEELGKTMVSQIQTRSQLGQAREEKKADYPAEALRELLHNAILHRQYLGTNAPVDFYWYDDRVEISSPGGPYGLLTIHNFAAPGLKDYRNPHLAGVLKDFRYIQRFGSGIPRAKRLCEQNGNKLEFTPSEARVLATIWRAP